MTLSSKIQIVLVTVGTLLAAWQFEQHRRTANELASVEAAIQAESRKLDDRQPALAAAEQHNCQLVEAERRAGNETLISLMRERAAAAAAAKSASEAAAETHSVGGALARVLDSPDQKEVDRESMRNEMRANMGLFFKLVKLSPEKINQYIDLQLEKESRKARRTAALLRGRVALADALHERDTDNQELESRQRAVLGTEGCVFIDSIAEGMRNDEARRLANGIQLALGGDTLNDQQREKLQSLLKTELVMLPLDDTDLFRPTDEWTQIVSEHQQNVLHAAADFLSPSQLETLKTLAAYDLAERQKQMMLSRKSLGIK